MGFTTGYTSICFLPFYPLELSTFISPVLEGFLPDSHFLTQGSAGPFWEALFLQSPALQRHPGEQRHLFFWQKGYVERMSRKKALFPTKFPFMLLFPDESNKQERFLNKWVTCMCFCICFNVCSWREESSSVPAFCNTTFCCSCFCVQHILFIKKSAELNSLCLRPQKLFCFPDQKPSKNFRTGPNGSAIIMSYYQCIL